MKPLSLPVFFLLLLCFLIFVSFGPDSYFFLVLVFFVLFSFFFGLILGLSKETWSFK